MADKKISGAGVTSTAPTRTDMLPIARVGSSVAYRVTIDDIRAGALDVHDFGALGDNATDDYISINIAIATGATYGYGQNRPGRLKLNFHPGKRYVITHPINLCDMEGIEMDGGSPNMGAVIVGKCAGEAMIEIIGSQSIVLRNLQLWGDQTLSPAVGTWTARSTTTHGTNSSNITFHNVTYMGYFNKACHYCIGSESNYFYECWTYLYGNTGLSGLVHVSTLNDFGLTPVNTTLAGTTYGNYDMGFFNCGLTSGVGYTAVVVRDYCHVSLHSTYAYSVTHPTILIDGGGGLRMRDVGFEGTPDNSIQINDGVYHNYYLDLQNINLGSPNNYSIYAADGTIMTRATFVGGVTPGLSGGTFKPMRFYRAEGCDLTGLHSNDSRPFQIIFDGSYSFECKFNLSSGDSLSYINGAYDVDSIVENFSTPFDAFLQVPAGGVKFNADSRLVSVKKATAAWTPGLVANGASATAYVAVSGVTNDALWVSMVSLTGLDEIGWDLSSYVAAGGVYATLTNRSGGDITVPAGTLLVVAMKVS